jgi:hypothetical protein
MRGRHAHSRDSCPETDEPGPTSRLGRRSATPGCQGGCLMTLLAADLEALRAVTNVPLLDVDQLYGSPSLPRRSQIHRTQGAVGLSSPNQRSVKSNETWRASPRATWLAMSMPPGLVSAHQPWTRVPSAQCFACGSAASAAGKWPPSGQRGVPRSSAATRRVPSGSRACGCARPFRTAPPAVPAVRRCARSRATTDLPLPGQQHRARTPGEHCPRSRVSDGSV